MNCRECGSTNTRVTGTVHSNNGDNFTVRRRRCSDCKCVFFTVELVDRSESAKELYNQLNSEREYRRVKERVLKNV